MFPLAVAAVPVLETVVSAVASVTAEDVLVGATYGALAGVELNELVNFFSDGKTKEAQKEVSLDVDDSKVEDSSKNEESQSDVDSQSEESNASSNLSLIDVLVENGKKMDVIAYYLQEISVSLKPAMQAITQDVVYRNTPQTVVIEDGVMNLTPNQIKTKKDILHSVYMSQELSLDGSELDDVENDFDMNSIFTELFKFKGISSDLDEIATKSQEYLEENEEDEELDDD